MTNANRLIETLLNSGLQRKSFDSMAAWFGSFNQQTRLFEGSIDRAILGGRLSLNVGFAFTSGYQSAIESLFQTGDVQSDELRLSSLCVTEAKGNHPRAIEARLYLDGGRYFIEGNKQFVSGACDSQLIYVACRDETTGSGFDDEGKPKLKVVTIPTQSQGVAIFSDDGSLISGPNLVFDVLPTLFDGMGAIGLFVAFGFFVLMSIAALTSSISMLEGPVSFAVERYNVERKKASTLVGFGIFIISALIVLNFDVLFGLVISISTVYGQPLIAMLCCVFVGWIWQRSEVLAEIKQGNDIVEHSLFWKIWPWYTKFVCPSAIAIVFFHSL